MVLRRVLVRVLAVLVGAVAAVPARAGDPAAAVRMSTFETVWRIVDEKFYDPNFNGVDWHAAHDRYAPLVASTSSDKELYAVLERMLGELKVSHFSIRPPTTSSEVTVDPSDASWGGGAGLTVSFVEGRVTVASVEPKGAAVEAGLRPGFVLTRIGTHDLVELAARTTSDESSPVRRSFRIRRAVQSLLMGMPGSRVEVAYLDGGDAPGTTVVVRRDRTGRPLTFGQLPTVLARVETKRIAGDVGYMSFNIFLPDLMNEIRAGIASLATAPAIIVDLRDNPGGIGLMAPAVASSFLTDASTLGSMKLRKGEIRFVTYRQPLVYSGPLVVLVDESTASTSEIFAGALQESGRAVVVGQTTLGAVLPSLIEKLPNGAIFQYAVADFRTPKGVLLEGRGVVPDVAVAVTRAELLAGHDPTLDAAVRFLASKGVATR